ncbi:response regulator [Archangium primigenium]|uniref:response regulator n=1 Tax=[Archangium] primigenium TaxID=2792470 RepID=UPI00195D0016|nr:response regulator [Archangium primigenium]MBM7114632.1 response regulator [Archangium primigenium]
MSTHPSPRRLLVIDDSEAIHTDFRRILTDEPLKSRGELDLMADALFGPEAADSHVGKTVVEVESAYQGEEGVARVREALAEGRPHALVFLDYRMPPGWNGAETLRHLRRVAPTLPVVLCSAYSDYSWTELQAEFGASRLLRQLRKPFNRQQVLALALGD